MWVFDHSCGHTAYAADALVAFRLNKKPGGNQPAMRDTVWAGQPQKLVEPDGTPSIEERGINTSNLKLHDMRTILANHDTFERKKMHLKQCCQKKATLLSSYPNSIVN